MSSLKENKKTPSKKKTSSKKTTTKKGSKKNVNRKGFTLVEILAMLVVLAIILAISVPNISGILSKQKENISLEDASKMVESAKIKVRTGTSVYLPSENNHCNIYTMAFLDSNDDYSTGTNGGTYDKYESFVIARKVVTKASEDATPEVNFEYYVRLYETVDGEAMGVEVTKLEDLEKDLKSHMKTFEKKVGITSVADPYDIQESLNEIDSSLCSEVERIYVTAESIRNNHSTEVS